MEFRFYVNTQKKGGNLPGKIILELNGHTRTNTSANT